MMCIMKSLLSKVKCLYGNERICHASIPCSEESARFNISCTLIIMMCEWYLPRCAQIKWNARIKYLLSFYSYTCIKIGILTAYWTRETGIMLQQWATALEMKSMRTRSHKECLIRSNGIKTNAAILNTRILLVVVLVFHGSVQHSDIVGGCD